MDPKIYEGFIKPQVIEFVKDHVEQIFAEMEGLFVEISNCVGAMKDNKTDSNFVQRKSRDA